MLEDNKDILEEFKKNSEERDKIHAELDKFKSFDDIKNNKEEFKKLTEQDMERMKRRQKMREELFPFIKDQED